MVDDSTIASLIRTALATVAATLAVGCTTDDTSDDLGSSGDGCGSPPDDPFEVSAWNLSAERFTGLTDYLAASELAWDELDDAHRCEVACLYANGLLSLYGAYDYFYGDTAVLSSCTLTLVVEADAVVGGSVSCAGVVEHHIGCIGGRRPLAWIDERECVRDVQAQLDGSARMEHASVTAFVELAAQLRSLGASEVLIERCLAAADDEQRHVDLLVALGAGRPDQRLASSSERSRLAIALHNATEGCVTETWAALLARYQSEHAPDEATRLAYARIADDEARHAQLAWDLHQWLCAGLTPSERAEVEAARADALARLATLATSDAFALPSAVRHALGLPDPRTARALAGEFGERLAAVA